MTLTTRLLYYTMRGLGLVACVLPRRVALALGSIFARLVWQLHLLTPYRDFVSTNIRTAQPELSRRAANRLGEASLIQLTRSIVELMRFPIFDREGDRIVEFVGAEHLEEALAAGKGAILMTAHFGNWELLGAALVRRFGPLAALVQTPSKDAFARLFIEYRHLVGVQTHSNWGPNALRPALRALRDNTMLLLLCDQHGAAQDAQATFFGQQVWVPLGPFALARRTGAAIVPARIVRGPHGVHQIHFDPAMVNQEDSDANAQAVVDFFESWIRHQPDHWLWVHNRWEFTVAAAARSLQMAAWIAVLAVAGLGRSGFAQGLDRPLLAAYGHRLEVLDVGQLATHGAVPLPGPADASLFLPDRQLLIVHIPSQAEVALVDLQPMSPTRFEIVRSFHAPEFGAYDLSFEKAGGDVLLGYGKTVVAHFRTQDWSDEVGYDRPDEIPYPFSGGSTLYSPSGIYTLSRGELDFEDTHPDISGAAATSWPVSLSGRPLAMVADQTGERLFVGEGTAAGSGLLAILDASSHRVVREVPCGHALTSLAWVDRGTLAALGGSAIGLFDTRSLAFSRWLEPHLRGGPPARLLPSGSLP
ncbi:MAG: lysophospholipid acyltransferase family protein [Cyanobacteria bacterium REEB65]|nr:lysophospholipid acyltransferase family protein [Cyanobacteria bacterium REEB65]